MHELKKRLSALKIARMLLDEAHCGIQTRSVLQIFNSPEWRAYKLSEDLFFHEYNKILCEAQRAEDFSTISSAAEMVDEINEATTFL